MRISAKGRYALASTVYMAQHHDSNEYITLIRISEKLGISKIYLEQVFSLLKHGKIVHSIKGAQGGYQLTRSPREITVYDILHSVETTLFEQAEETVSASLPEIEQAISATVYQPLDHSIESTLQGISLYDLVTETEKQNTDQGAMFFI
ncbi:Rrf2 family protein [Anaerotaenia torta]|uniref:RrF2 family transcriptional regulator n=1 Tax=Anaerotaenia torta TaxID=433293 RepID=UPI003D1B8305